MRDKLLEEIGSTVFTALIDETTDEANLIQLDVHIRWSQILPKNKLHTREDFLGMIALPNGEAQTIYDALVKCLIQNGLKPARMISIGTDGASTMTGRHNGTYYHGNIAIYCIIILLMINF